MRHSFSDDVGARWLSAIRSVSPVLLVALFGRTAEAAESQRLGNVVPAITVEYFDSQHSDRDISVATLAMEGFAPLIAGVTIGVGGDVVVVEGTRSLEDDARRPRKSADALGIGVSAAVRISPVSIWIFRPFADASTGMIFTTAALSPGGSRGNFRHRLGFGASMGLTDSFSVMVAFRRVYVTSGRGFSHEEGDRFKGNGVAAGLMWR